LSVAYRAEHPGEFQSAARIIERQSAKMIVIIMRATSPVSAQRRTSGGARRSNPKVPTPTEKINPNAPLIPLLIVDKSSLICYYSSIEIKHIKKGPRQ
jgi:hypothetical protein